MSLSGLLAKVGKLDIVHAVLDVLKQNKNQQNHHNKQVISLFCPIYICPK